MANTKVFVGGIAHVDEDTLRDTFSKYGEITDLFVVREREPDESGQRKSKGFGFITFSDASGVDGAIKGMVNGRVRGLVSSRFLMLPVEVVVMVIMDMEEEVVAVAVMVVEMAVMGEEEVVREV